MGLNWVDVARKYIARKEMDGKRPSINGIKRMITSEDDYKLCLRCPRGEIYRYDLSGNTWAVYVKGSKTNKKRKALWNEFNKLGLTLIQAGDYEASWKFPVDLLDTIAKIMVIRRVRKRPKKEIV